ncbi:MAG: glycosyltransferase [Thermodesulfobacteriota bacterium]|nr:glycosyltransferase [Thermodesulfobacteriota bacterium]
MLSSGFGGGERLFVDLCLALADAGHLINAVCHPEFQAKSHLHHPGVEVSHLKAHWDWSPLAFYRLARLVREFRPAVIHSHLARGASVAGHGGSMAGVPVVANLHNYVKLKYYRKVSYFLPGTEDQRQYLMAQGVPADTITVVPHFSLVPIVLQTETPTMEVPLFITYGRFVRKKGFHVLVESLRLLHERGLPARLILGGDGPERDPLQKQIYEAGLTEEVELVGWVEDVPQFLSQSPFFILPSLDEPFGIVILEAMARKKVIISTTTQGPKEVLDNTTAYLLPPDDPVALADSMYRAFADKEGSWGRAQAAWDRYKSRYSPEKIIPQFEVVYRDLAERFV